ncbi:hypothetical protein BDZ45DRAFT_742898 [Acephala macrosclerotiorum]|nr:hypothetical protein BDZ45DRAFT_742898 [Acephala macrosclerotiorum]
MSIATVTAEKRENVSIAIGAIFEQPWSGHGRGALKTAELDGVPIIIAVLYHHQNKRLASLQAVRPRGTLPCVPWPYELAETNPMPSLKAVGVNYRRPLTPALGIVQLTFGGPPMTFKPLIRANTHCLILEALTRCSSLASLAVRRQDGVIFSFTGTRMTAFSHLYQDAEAFGEQEPSQEAVGPSARSPERCKVAPAIVGRCTKDVKSQEQFEAVADMVDNGVCNQCNGIEGSYSTSSQICVLNTPSLISRCPVPKSPCAMILETLLGDLLASPLVSFWKLEHREFIGGATLGLSRVTLYRKRATQHRCRGLLTVLGLEFETVEEVGHSVSRRQQEITRPP